jgi:hypothetical protein
MASPNSLDLVNTFITGTIPTQIENMANLQVLLLENDELQQGKIPSELLGRLSGLQILDLADNDFTTGAVPGQLSTLSKWKLRVLMATISVEVSTLSFATPT